MNKILFTLISAVLVGFFFSAAQAQIRTPQASPTAKVEQNFGLGTITLDYSRPSMKGRKIFGELVPFGAVWRTGANASTKLTFSSDVMVQGNEVEAGTYALYTIPGERSWTVMLYNDLTLGGSVARYDQTKEYLRFEVKPMSLPFQVETFTIDFNDMRDNSATINLVWESTQISLNVEADIDTEVMAAIERTMAGPSGNDYFAAARYYYQTDKDMDQALTWINKALENEERYWVMTWKARILARMERWEEAMKTSERAKALAEAAPNPDYVKINDDLMAEIREKM